MGSLGRPGDPSQDVLALVVARGFSDTFPAAAMDDAARVEPTVSEDEARGENRRDLRGLQLVTIDGADARDFDDAVWAEELPGGGTRLLVAIADVSHYVLPGQRPGHRGLPPGDERLPPGPGAPHAAGAPLQRHLLAAARRGPALPGGGHGLRRRGGAAQRRRSTRR